MNKRLPNCLDIVLLVVQTLGIRDSSVFCSSSSSQMLPLSQWMATPQILARVDGSFDNQMASHEKTKKKKPTLPLDCLLIRVRVNGGERV